MAPEHTAAGAPGSGTATADRDTDRTAGTRLLATAARSAAVPPPAA